MSPVTNAPCPSCGREHDPDDRFCMYCGHSLEPAPPEGNGVAKPELPFAPPARPPAGAAPPPPPPPVQAPPPPAWSPAVVHQPSKGRGVAATIVLIVGLVVLAVGIAGLLVADHYKPTFANAIANNGNVLSPDSYNTIKAIAWLLIALGAVGTLVSVVLLATRRSTLVVQGATGAQPAPAPRPSYASTPFAEIPRAPAAWQGYRLASWGKRVGASLLDGLIVVPFFVIISLAIGGFGGVGGYVLFGMLALGAQLAYASLTMLRSGANAGQTLGKQVAGIRVVCADRQPLDFGTVGLREVVLKGILFGWLSILTLYVATLLNDLWPLWDDENRALHDMLASTRVVEA